MARPNLGAGIDVWAAADWTGSTESIVQDVLGSYPASRDGAIQLWRDAHGRLNVEGNDLDVSVSHTEGVVLVALGLGCRAGVDIEILRDRRVHRLPEHALSAAELRELKRFDAAGRLAAFLSYWVRKEALLKAAGFGLAIEPASITLPPPGSTTVTSGPAELEPIEQWAIRELAIEGYVAAVAADVRSPTVRVRRLITAAGGRRERRLGHD
jgi:4'-phosphopantetheinyl transferase